MDIFLEYIRFLVNTADRPGGNFVRLIHGVAVGYFCTLHYGMQIELFIGE